MRFHTAISASRSTAPTISINAPPNERYPHEVHVSFGGLSVWLTEAEATALGQRLIEAGIRIRNDAAAKQEGESDE